MGWGRDTFLFTNEYLQRLVRPCKHSQVVERSTTTHCYHPPRHPNTDINIQGGFARHNTLDGCAGPGDLECPVCVSLPAWFYKKAPAEESKPHSVPALVHPPPQTTTITPLSRAKNVEFLGKTQKAPVRSHVTQWLSGPEAICGLLVLKSQSHIEAILHLFTIYYFSSQQKRQLFIVPCSNLCILIHYLVCK